MSQKSPFDLFSGMDVEKMLKDFKLPGMDVKGLVDSQSRNAQAVAEANRVSLEGIRSLSERQTAIMRETFDEVRQAFAEIRGADNLEDAANRQSEIARKAMEKGMANMRELTEMVSKSNSDAFEVVNQRMNESLEEFRKLFSGISK